MADTPRDTADNSTAGGAGPLNFASWAESLVAQVAKDVSPGTKAVLHRQVASIVQQPLTPAPSRIDPTQPTIVRDQESLDRLAAALAGVEYLVIDLETSSLKPRSGSIVGVGLAFDQQTAYVPVGHRFADTHELLPNQLPISSVVRALHLGERALIAHNAKFEFQWLRRHAGITCQFSWDTMIAALVQRSELPADLKRLADRELDVPDWSLTKAQITQIQFLPPRQAAAYCAKDCWYTLEIYRRQRTCLQ